MGELVVDGKAITRDGPAYVIAEIGNNHQGDLEKAKALIHAARECGVDAVEDGVTGVLVPSRDPAALRRAVEALMGDPELRRRLGSAARDAAREKFSWRVTTEATIAAYRDADALRSR